LHVSDRFEETTPIFPINGLEVETVEVFQKNGLDDQARLFIKLLSVIVAFTIGTVENLTKLRAKRIIVKRISVFLKKRGIVTISGFS
jgi:hypothetical protein